MEKILFVGAGPGDPELITIKGKSAVENADVIVYAGSLVNPEILGWNKRNALIKDSAEMDLEEIMETMITACRQSKKVVRLHTGDPSIYGAIGEQMARLDKEAIPYEVIPGVSSFLGGASVLRKELTVPEICQTVIVSRCEGRTPVPEKESLQKLAAIRATLILFLSASAPEKTQAELLTGYPPETPVAVVYKATWKEEQIYRGTLENLASIIKENKITKTALIYVGDFLKEGQETASKLYDNRFTHEYRKGKNDR